MLANHVEAQIAIQQSSVGRNKGMTEVIFRKASPCPVDWSKMSGDNKVRWCESCKHFTYNRQKESVATVLSWIWFREGLRPAVLYLREDGAVMTVDCRAGARKNSVILTSKIAAGVAVAVLVMAWLSAPPPQSNQQSLTVESPATAQPKEPEIKPAASKPIMQNQPHRHIGTWVIPNLKSSPANEQLTFQQIQTGLPTSTSAEPQADIELRNATTNTNQGTTQINAPALNFQAAPAPQAELSPANSLVKAEPLSGEALANETSPQPEKSRPDTSRYIWDSRLAAGKN